MMDLGPGRRRYSPDGVNSAEDLGGGPDSRVIQSLDAYLVPERKASAGFLAKVGIFPDQFGFRL
jgi:hypothetical protein